MSDRKIVDQLNGLYSEQRTGKDNSETKKDDGVRTQYQRDFDRIVFSSSFRRLQNKTQVFSLPGSNFVHNRLTHSLEVASVGRSLGTIIGRFIVDKYYDREKLSEEDLDSKKFYNNELSNVIAAACLCHDIGNTAFGHSGEDAIVTYFENNKQYLKNRFSEEEWNDFIHFEGNANSFRLLTRQQNGKRAGGLGLTYSTLAAIAKYPCSSSLKDGKAIHRKKFGFFNSCKEEFQKVADGTSMKRYFEVIAGKNQVGYHRHPFVWLVEAADDICYNIIDLEDAHRLKIISFKICKEKKLNLIDSIDSDFRKDVELKLTDIDDKNEEIAYLRSKAINCLITKAVEVYEDNFLKILKFELKEDILSLIGKSIGHDRVKDIKKFSKEEIYPSSKVAITQTAGYNVLEKLLSLFVPVILDRGKRNGYQENLFNLIPKQFLSLDTNTSDYDKVMSVLDFVSGMTDNYATALFQHITGIEIGMRYQ